MADGGVGRERDDVERTALAGVRVALNIESKAFGRAKPVLSHVEFAASPGQIIAVLGPSGSGKTTLLRMLAGLDRDFTGSITCDGVEIAGPGANRAIVFQESRLLPWYRVRQNVLYGAPDTLRGKAKAERADRLLRLVELQDFQKMWPRELSGGMEKRVALARALMAEPQVLLLDEPFGALDYSARIALQAELLTLRSRLQFTTVIVTHDVEEAIFLADRVIVLGGQPATVVADVPIDLAHPRDRTGRGFDELRLSVLATVLRTEHRHQR